MASDSSSCVIIYLILTIIVLSQVHASSYEDSRDLHLHLLKDYSKILNPRKNQSEPVIVNVTMYLNSVIDFNPVSGLITFSAGFVLSWNDHIIKSRWHDSPFSEINETRIGLHDVWVPKLFIQNSVNLGSLFQFASRMDSETSFVEYTRNGGALFSIGATFHTTCLTDVTYYPLDEHECDVTVVPLDFTSTVLHTYISDVMTPVTYPNSEWNMRSTVIVENVMGIYNRIKFKVVLSRKPVFITTNLVFPVMIITVINGLSFFVPIESGERLSFGTSLLLMLIVFLTTVLDMLPPTDDTLSHFNIFICMELCYSCFITFGIIITLFLHQLSNDTKVSGILATFTNKILKRKRNGCSKPPKNVVSAVDLEIDVDPNVEKKTTRLSDFLEQDKKVTAVSWSEFASAVDKLLRIVSTIYTFCLFIIFVIFFSWVNIVY